MINLCPYKPSDREGIYQLFYETVHRVNCRDYTEDQINAWAPQEPLDSLLADLDKNFTRVAFEAGSMVGFVELTSEGLVKGLFTHYKAQGKGIGTLLMQAAFKEAKRLKLKKLYLESSLTARSFYEKLGFVVKEEKIKEARGQSFEIIIMEAPIT